MVGVRDPPPYFWVEEFKKRGIRAVWVSGGAQFQDLGLVLGLVLGQVFPCFCVLQLMPCGTEYPCRCHLCVSDYFCGQHCHKITDVYLSSGDYIKIFQNVLIDFYDRLPLSGAVGMGGGQLLGADGGVVAADEMRIGRRKKGYYGHKTRPLADVVGAVEQQPGGRLILEIMPKLHNGKMRQKGPPTAAEIRPFARAFVQPGAGVYTDGARAYEVLAREFSWDHHAVSHKKGEWVRQEGNTKVHTNKIDGLWAHVRGFINPAPKAKQRL